jgi:DNA-binding MarR family transcriptional regulator
MDIDARKKVANSLITFIPVFYRKFFHTISCSEVSRQQLMLLFHLMMEGGMPMNHYCNAMMISKPNLTVLAEKLIQEGYIERDYVPGDRRVILLKITKNGKEYMHQEKEKIMAVMLNKIAALDDIDILHLKELMEATQKILIKLDDNK